MVGQWIVSTLQQNARTVTSSPSDGMFHLTDQLGRTWHSSVRLPELMKLAWANLLWGSQVNSSAKSSSTTTSTGKAFSSAMPAYVVRQTTQLPPRMRYVHVGRVSYRSWKNAEYARLWLWVTRPQGRCWELRVVSRSYGSAPRVKYRSLDFRSYPPSIRQRA
jgi:hypothetical protein